MSGPQQVGGNQPLVGCFIPPKPAPPVNPVVPVPAHQDQNLQKPPNCVNPPAPDEGKPGCCVPPSFNFNNQGGNIFKNESGSNNINNINNSGANSFSPVKPS